MIVERVSLTPQIRSTRRSIKGAPKRDGVAGDSAAGNAAGWPKPPTVGAREKVGVAGVRIGVLPKLRPCPKMEPVDGLTAAVDWPPSPNPLKPAAVCTF